MATPCKRLRRRAGGCALVAMFLTAPVLIAATSQPAPIEGLYIHPGLSADPPEGMLIDAWYRLELLGQPAGYVRMAMRRQGDRVESLDYTAIRIARGPAQIEVTTKTRTVETLDGRPLEIHTEQVFANQPMQYDALFTPDGQIDLKVTQSGNVVSRRFPADPQATLPWSLVRGLLTGRRKAGDSFVERSYSFDTDTKPLTVRHESAGRTEVELLPGRKLPVWRYRIVYEGLPSDGEVFCEPQYLVPVKLVMSVLNMKLVATITTREKAEAVATQRPVEMLASTLLHARVSNGRDPSQADGVLYRLSLPEGEDMPDLLETGMQRVVQRKGREVELLVTRRGSQKQRSGMAPLSAEQRAMYLRATAYANSDDEAVRRLAAEAAGDEKDPARLAARLCRYVYAKVKNKGFDVAFASASETARTLQGDCTEHAVLLAALARACGLPARAAVGMVALPGSYASGTVMMGYHMWTQIHIDGQWQDFDAAFDQPEPDATHIALGISDLDDTSIPLASVSTFARIAGKVELSATVRQ